MKKITVIIIFNLFICMTAFAQNKNDFIFDGKGTITGYIGNNTSIIIPSEINNIPVTEIGYKAFSEKNLTDVTIPNGVITIGACAFYKNQITSITLPDTVTTIEFYAFSYNQLTSIIIPDNVKEIDDGAFSNNQLSSVIIGKGLKKIEEEVFENNKLTSIFIPSNIISFEGSALIDNEITSITTNGYVMFSGGILNEILYNFEHFYIINNRKAGTYEYKNNRWNFTNLKINI